MVWVSSGLRQGKGGYRWLLLHGSTIANIFSSGRGLLSATSSDGGTKV
jgi:hypothetical protein